jgi:release factor glutamine methyltransferase
MVSLISYIHQALQKEFSSDEIKSLSPIICSDLLGLKAIDLYTCKDTDLSEENLKKLQYIINRLLRHEPIQYICGDTLFCGLSFKVTSDVLIPRPETEELVYLIAKENKGKCRILDIGTGSGCIAISLDKLLPDADVTAWDISPAALDVAKINNQQLKTAVSFVQQDIFADTSDKSLYDIIVSNPPYVTESDKSEMQREVLDYEPSLALFVPDADPLLYYKRISIKAKEMMTSKGKLYLEINQRFGQQVAEVLTKDGWREVLVIKDQFNNDRIVTATL